VKTHIVFDMEKIDWHTLRSFVAVAEEGHITRAAERLNTHQPPLSQRIGALEKRLEVKLFLRKPRGVELTAAGGVLLIHARMLLDQHAKAVDAVQRAGRGELGRLSIATVPTGPMHPLMPLSVRKFRERYPDASVTLEECLRDELLQRLRQDQVDVAFMRSVPEDASGLAVEILLNEPMVVALPRGHALGKRGATAAVEMRDLKCEPFIVFARQQGPAIYDSTLAACERAGFSPHIAQEATRVTMALGLVAAGLGITVVPASMQRIALDGVVFRAIDDRAGLKAVLALGWRKNDASPALANFVELVRRMAAA
jgi:DNA-binding transcriptional LysR family regulator